LFSHSQQLDTAVTLKKRTWRAGKDQPHPSSRRAQFSVDEKPALYAVHVVPSIENWILKPLSLWQYGPPMSPSSHQYPVDTPTKVNWFTNALAPVPKSYTYSYSLEELVAAWNQVYCPFMKASALVVSSALHAILVASVMLGSFGEPHVPPTHTLSPVQSVLFVHAAQVMGVSVQVAVMPSVGREYSQSHRVSQLCGPSLYLPASQLMQDPGAVAMQPARSVPATQVPQSVHDALPYASAYLPVWQCAHSVCFLTSVYIPIGQSSQLVCSVPGLNWPVVQSVHSRSL
jgi:hypothetical protein